MRLLWPIAILSVTLPLALSMPKLVAQGMSPPAPPVVRTPASQIKPLTKSAESLYSQTRQLSAKDVARLRARIAKAPGDTDARALLLTHTMFDRGDDKLRRLHNEQVVWFVANLPDSPVLSSGYVDVDSVLNARTYDLVDELYANALVRYPKNPNVATNYAGLLKISDSTRAIELYRRAAELDPKNADRYSDLAFAYSLASRGLMGRDKVLASRAVDNYLKAQALGKQVQAKFLLQAAFDANRMDVLEKVAGSALKGEADDVHAAHTTLGLVALKRGDMTVAKSHLLASADVAGSPVLGSFGPDMDLAKELLARGERKTVLEYLQATGKFWQDERQVRWTKTVANGGTPDWR